MNDHTVTMNSISPVYDEVPPRREPNWENYFLMPTHLSSTANLLRMISQELQSDNAVMALQEHAKLLEALAEDQKYIARILRVSPFRFRSAFGDKMKIKLSIEALKYLTPDAEKQVVRENEVETPVIEEVPDPKPDPKEVKLTVVRNLDKSSTELVENPRDPKHPDLFLWDDNAEIQRASHMTFKENKAVPGVYEITLGKHQLGNFPYARAKAICRYADWIEECMRDQVEYTHSDLCDWADDFAQEGE